MQHVRGALLDKDDEGSDGEEVTRALANNIVSTLCALGVLCGEFSLVYSS
ncbi:hypothetical protein MNV_390007 [Candidatus Methanoperedens nitroreducens]|uniref:Uncharacterized protein n=1 Tax=Candidatus Methanoperedens nitratireducens TaxID=1392998 RepID=A0A284VQG1_9EURY|nr:hypothetical protein MNV_390007 [Candidatus Methanoperedens nitroreducens]